MDKKGGIISLVEGPSVSRAPSPYENKFEQKEQDGKEIGGV
jgi:hypothetical protein